MQRLYHKMRPNRYGDCYTNQGIDPSTLRHTQGVASRQLSVRLSAHAEFPVADEDGEGRLS
jgi:hypothetical protein